MFRSSKLIRPATENDRLEWDRVVSHPLQTWAWGEFRQAMGVAVVRLAIERNTTRGRRPRPEPAEGWQLTFHQLPHLPLTIGYFPKGPSPSRQMIQALIDLARKKRAIFIQLEPNVQHEDTKILRYLDTKSKNPFSQYLNILISQYPSLRPSHHPLFTKYTFVLDLRKSEDDLLSAMHSKTRYNIRVAQRHGVVVKEDNSPQAFEEYLRLSRETTGRQGFYAHNELYHQKMWEIMRQANIAHLFTAVYQGMVLAAWIVFIWKDTIYYPYGASSREHREVMAPTLLLWEIARWAKKEGLKYFDLWGALGPNPDPKDPWYGFHRFKQGFSPALVEFVGSYDLVINPFLYLLYKVGDRLRWLLLRLKTTSIMPIYK